MLVRIIRTDRAGNRIPNTPDYGSEAGAIAACQPGEWVAVEVQTHKPGGKPGWKFKRNIGWRDSGGAWHDLRD